MQTFFTNVFRTSASELSLSETGAPFITIEAARKEAIRYSLEHSWEYLCTLTNGLALDFHKDIELEREERADQAADDRKFGTYEQQQYRAHQARIHS